MLVVNATESGVPPHVHSPLPRHRNYCAWSAAFVLLIFFCTHMHGRVYGTRHGRSGFGDCDDGKWHGIIGLPCKPAQFAMEQHLDPRSQSLSIAAHELLSCSLPCNTSNSLRVNPLMFQVRHRCAESLPDFRQVPVASRRGGRARGAVRRRSAFHRAHTTF